MVPVHLLFPVQLLFRKCRQHMPRMLPGEPVWEVASRLAPREPFFCLFFSSMSRSSRRILGSLFVAEQSQAPHSTHVMQKKRPPFCGFLSGAKRLLSQNMPVMPPCISSRVSEPLHKAQGWDHALPGVRGGNDFPTVLGFLHKARCVDAN